MWLLVSLHVCVVSSGSKGLWVSLLVAVPIAAFQALIALAMVVSSGPSRIWWRG